LAGTYYLRKDFKQASVYYLKVLEHRIKNINDNLGYTYFNLGLTYKESNELDKALDYFKQTLAVGKEIGSSDLEISAQLQLGKLYVIQKNYPTAIQEFTTAEQLAEQDKNTHLNLLIDITDTFSKLYEEMGDDSKAMDYVHKKEAWQNIAKAEREQITKLLEKQRFDTVKWEDTVEKGKEDKGISIWWYILSAVVISFVAGVKGAKIYTGIQNALSIIPKKKKTKNSLTETGTITSSEAEAIQDKLSQIERFKEANMSIPKRHLVDLWHLVKKTNWFQKSGDEK
jgi:Tfp pilus assembly protein PilF